MSKGTFIAFVSRSALAVIAAIIAVVALVPPSSAAASGEITGVYEIRNSATHKCLTVNGGNVNSQQPMIQFQCGRDYGYSWGYQRFQFERAPLPGWFFVHPRSNANLCLGMAFTPSGSNIFVDGVSLQQQTCTGSTYQMFTLKFENLFADGNSRNKIVSYRSSKCMQVNGGENNWDNYVQVSQWNCANTGMHLNWDFKWLAHR